MMALYFTGEIVGVKRKAPEVITMVNGYPHVTYPAFDIVGKILWKNLPKDKYEVKVNNRNCILRLSDCDIFTIDYAGESEVFDSILLNDPLSQPYIYLGEFADHVLNKKRKTFGFGGFTQLSKKELEYAEADVKATKEALNATFRALEHFPGYHYRPVESSLKALDDFNRREAERIAASPIRIDIDDEIKAHYSKEEIKKMINNVFGKPVAMFNYHYKKIIFSGPCTIILWKDGTKTIAKTSDGETFDPEKGVSICFMKKMLGHTETNKILRKANKDFYDEVTKRAEKDLKEGLTPMDEYLGGKVIFDDMSAFLKNSMLTNTVVNIDQSTIDEVKKVEEEQDD